MHDILGQGNEIKTRAQVSYIIYNLIDEGTGSGSWECDIAQGGLTVIMGNVFVQGTSSSNHGMIGWDAATNTLEELYFVNNTVINQYAGNGEYFNMVPTSGITVFKVYNNCFASNSGSVMTWLKGGTGGAVLDSASNRILPDYTKLGFVNPVYPASNYNLTSLSTPLIDNGTNGGTASNGYSLTPLFEYAACMSALIPRTIAGSKIDIGAYEYYKPAGVEAISANGSDFYVYSDAVNRSLDIRFSNQSRALKQVQIFDMAGKLLIRKENISGASIICPVNALAAGVYIVQVQTENSVANKKIVVN